MVGRFARRSSGGLGGRVRHTARAVVFSCLAACSGGAEPSAATPPPTESPRLAWTDCHDGLSCASLDVPVDWAKGATDPSASKLALALIRVSAGDPSARIGTVVINPGGPGKPMVEDLAENLVRYRLAFAEAFRRFDVVAFDWRGGGGSAPLRCASDGFLDGDFRRASFSLEEEAEVATVEPVRASYVRACAEENDATLLSNVGTEAAARDLEALREALGEERLNFLGFSYGTRLGATYAALYPGRVRAFVLDSAVLPEPVLERRIAARVASVDAALTRFATACSAPDSAFHGGDAPARVLDAVAALRTGLRPAATPAAPARVLTRLDFDVAFFAGLSSGQFAALATDLSALEAGDGSAFLARADEVLGRAPDGRYDGTLATSLAITCLDSPLEAQTVAEYAAFAASLGASLARNLATSPWAVCAGWPWRAAQANVAAPARGAPPMLLVEGAFDPNSGVAEARALLGALDNGSHLLIYEGDGHIAALRSACVRAAMGAFFVDPSVAPPVSCPAE